MPRLSYRNPIAPDRITLRDPVILRHGPGYYLYGTTRGGKGDESDGFDAWFSRDLVNWTFAGDVYNRSGAAAWNQYQFRSPEVYSLNGRFHMFYSANSDDGRRGVGVASSPSPLGPFTDGPHNPITPRDRDCLDPHLFTDPGGTHWLFYAQEWTQCGDGRIYVQRVSNDLTRLEGDPIRLLTAGDAPWAIQTQSPDGKRGRVLEAPCLLFHSETYYLMCSSVAEQGCCVGYFTAKQLTGPYTPGAQVIRRDGGHNWVFPAPDARRLLTCYHSPNEPAGQERLCIDELRILQDGSLWVDESRDEPRDIPLPDPQQIAE